MSDGNGNELKVASQGLREGAISKRPENKEMTHSLCSQRLQSWSMC